MVEVYSWNPRRPVLKGSIGKKLPIKKRLNNFGDLLGPLVVHQMLKRHRVTAVSTRPESRRLLSIGSVLHYAHDGDTIWGTGVNGKVRPQSHQFTFLDVRAVRGPMTRDFLSSRGIFTPPVFGDPALLLPMLLPWLRSLAADRKRYAVTVVPNLNDLSLGSTRQDWVLSPLTPTKHVLERIARSAFVTGSSLHAIVVAESLGIPARLVRSQHEHSFKYEDYYLGSGRSEFSVAESAEEALEMGGEYPLSWDARPLLDAFPKDLWEEPG
jgi:pyruvyltransferase